MDTETYRHAELIALLKERGATEYEVAAILARIHVYDENIGRDLLMEQLANGSLSLDALLREPAAGET